MSDSDTGYLETREVSGSISDRVYLQLAPVDFDIRDGDELPTIEDIKYEIEEKLLNAVADQIRHGHADIEVDDIDEIAAEILESLKAQIAVESGK